MCTDHDRTSYRLRLALALAEAAAEYSTDSEFNARFEAAILEYRTATMPKRKRSSVPCERTQSTRCDLTRLCEVIVLRNYGEVR